MITLGQPMRPMLCDQIFCAGAAAQLYAIDAKPKYSLYTKHMIF